MAPDPTPLARLHDIHLPAPAGADWIVLLLAAIVALAGFALIAWGLWRRRRRRPAVVRLVELQQLPPEARLTAYASLLRQAVLATSADPAPGRLSGEPWLRHLDRRFATTFFSDGPGRVFGNDLYRPGVAPDWPALDRALRRMLA